MKLFYPAVFTRKAVGYSTALPDLAGCFSEGDSFIEAYRNTKSAAELYLRDIPEPPKVAALETLDFDSTTQFICVVELEK